VILHCQFIIVTYDSKNYGFSFDLMKGRNFIEEGRGRILMEGNVNLYFNHL